MSLISGEDAHGSEQLSPLPAMSLASHKMEKAGLLNPCAATTEVFKARTRVLQENPCNAKKPSTHS